MPALHFRERGKGAPVILIHGFPFNQNIWNDFAEKLARDFRVITIDLPGFGESAQLAGQFSIDDVGQQVTSWIKETGLQGSVLIGHSLGGYVALSVAAAEPSYISGLALFHSTALPDSEEKKQSRNKVLEFIASNGVSAFTSNFITPLFADPNSPTVAWVRSIATEASREAVTGYTVAMRDRKDRTTALKAFPGPVLFVTGEKDPGITVESIEKQATLCRSPHVYVLTQVAHMGMFEDEKRCLEIFRKFVGECQLPGR